MGVWGTGIYAGDFALDLRSSIRGVARLPLEGDELLSILRRMNAGEANDPNNEEHTVFWLVVADQFARRGIVSKVAQEHALALLESGADLAMCEKLGMKGSMLRKRTENLRALALRLREPVVPKQRNVVRKAQPLLFELGGIYVYPTSRGNPINAYFPSKDRIPGWSHDGWAAMTIIDRGYAFDYLAWYRPITLAQALADRPEPSQLRGWKLKLPGSCPAAHFKKMEIQQIGRVSLDGDAVARAFGSLRPGISQAIEDITIGNRMHTTPAGNMPPSYPPTPRIESLSEICNTG